MYTIYIYTWNVFGKLQGYDNKETYSIWNMFGILKGDLVKFIGE